jgi:hypothetical protein
MKRASAFLILAAIFSLVAAQGCDRSPAEEFGSDVKEAGRDMKRGVQDAVD